jgi:aminoglycoside/choline kinase family phosphotransferase
VSDAVLLEAADVTVAWISDALRQSGHAVAGRLKSVELEPVGAGTGMFGHVLRLLLTYERRQPQDPASLILKMPSATASNRSRALAFDMYAREARFYGSVAGMLNVRVPRCYWSCIDPDTHQAAVLLEDLGCMHVEDQVTGIGPRRARVAVSRLAAGHAQWWDAAGLADLDWMPYLASPITGQLAQVYRDQWSAFVEHHGAQLPDGCVPLGEHVGDRVEELLELLSEPPVTIVHGDFRLDNLYFGDAPAADPLVVADWQLSCRGRGAFDVTYLLCQSMTVEDRRQNEVEILRCWHQTLVDSGVVGYSFDDAVDDYTRSALICLAYAVAGTVLDRSNERGQALARVQAVRTFTAALDLNAVSMLTSGRSKAGSVAP